MASSSIPFTIALADGAGISALLDAPADAWACYVFAHGAGAGMDHGFMAAMATGLAARGVASLRFQFPFMEKGSKRPDPPHVAQAAVRAAVREAAGRLPRVPLFAGGKSFGGRMTSQAQAIQRLPNVEGLVFVGFPLHPAGKPATGRAEHLAGVEVPMLFLQGTRDALADLDLVRETTATLADRATLHVVDGADHAFHVLVRSGRNDEQVREELLDTMAGWMQRIVR
jgi:predicted alpha/beta-hydrolase family hydrolase